ncbi:NACHT domain-containing protein [Catenulispora yoronensis]
MDQARVVEVWAPGVKRVGSGYLLADGLVLTSYHIVQGLEHGARVEVRPLEVPQRTGWLATTLAWPVEAVDITAFPERDAALLVIDREGAAGPFVGSVRFGLVTGQNRIPCQGLGFPDAERRPDRQRDTMAVRGHVDALQARKSGLMTVHVDEGIVPRSLDGGSGWAGASGTAMFCKSLLVGILATDHAVANDASVLRAVPVSALVDLPGFREILAAHQVHPRLEHASPAAQWLSAYLAVAHRAATEHPYAGVLPGTTPPLAAVYLHQQIHRLDGADEPAVLDGPVAAVGGRADEVLADPPTCLIMAGPGGGKSSLLRTRLAEGVKRWQDGQAEELLPVLTHASEFAERTLVGALLAGNSDLGVTGEPSEAFFRSPPRPGARWLVLLDGLDEVADPAQRKKILHKVAVITTGEYAHLYRIVIATRPLPDSELDILGPGVPRYDLQPFKSGDLETIARAWFSAAALADPESTAKRFVQALNASRLADLARVPLMSAMLCQLHTAAVRQGRPDQPLPPHRGQIYRDFIDLLRKVPPVTPAARYPGLERNPEAYSSADRTLTHLRGLIAYLAFRRQTGDTRSALTILESQPTARCPEGVRADNWRAFLGASLRRSGLLTERGGDFTFLHQTLQEHLAAQHFMSSVRTSWPPPGATVSYTGFLIDAAHEKAPVEGIEYLRSQTQQGLPGLEAIATLYELRTTIPDEILRTTNRQLHVITSDPNGFSRVRAAQALAKMGDPGASEVLHAFATDALLESRARVQAARALAEMGDSRASSLLTELVRDPSLHYLDRQQAVAALAETGGPGTDDFLHTLAEETTVPGTVRMAAVQALADAADPRVNDLLVAFTRGTTLTKGIRAQAAEMLGKAGNSRAGDLLYAFAQDPALSMSGRQQAIWALAGLGDPRGSDLLHVYAQDVSLDIRVRIRAARTLAEASDSRVGDILMGLAQDAALARVDRVQAAQLLARTSDSRAGDFLHGLARDSSLHYLDRQQVVAALAETSGSGTRDFLYSLAQDTTVPSTVRAAAASGLAEAGDPRARDLLAGLARGTTLSKGARSQAAEALAKAGDPRAADLLHAFAQDPPSATPAEYGPPRRWQNRSIPAQATCWQAWPETPPSPTTTSRRQTRFWPRPAILVPWSPTMTTVRRRFHGKPLSSTVLSSAAWCPKESIVF